MRRTITCAAIVAAFGGLTADADAQEPQARSIEAQSPSRFDVSIYAAGSWTSPWLEAEGTSFGIGLNPMLGTSAVAWITPHFGVRLHGAYMPSDIPRAEGLDSLGTDGRPLNVWLYDIELTARPFATSSSASSQLASLYLWLGGGGLTVNPAGDGSPEENGCVFPYSLGDACLSYSGHNGTVGQVTAGGGMNLFSITESLGIFGELGIHAYDSPFHLGSQWTGRTPQCATCIADDGMAVTTRFVLGGRLALGNRSPAPRAVMAPLPPPPATPPPPALPPPPPERSIEMCVVDDGMPRYVDALVLPESGDTVIVRNGIRRPLRAAYPTMATSAAGESWYTNNEDIVVEGRPYVKFGVARTLEPGDIERAGEYQGVPFFRPADEPATPASTIYVPAGDGCQFQPYQMGDRVRRVRG